MKAKHLLLAAALLFGGCNSGINLMKDRAYFKSFTYTGNDPCFEQSRLQEGEIFNPVLQGAYSDASVCRKGGDYYMVTSTYTFFPGLAVLHSKDLVNWEQVSYALPTERQCLNTSLKSTQGLFPSTIRYNKHDDYFYITGTFVGGGGHFIIKTKDPAGEWSDPEWIFGIGGVHPSLFIDDDGTAYLLNQGTPDRVPDYPDFKVIWMQRFNLQTMKTEGERKIILAGGDIPEKKPAWLEAPHLFKIDGYYYLTASEGGSLGNGFASCVYRSSEVFGPYTRYGNNPILTQRRLTAGREDAVISTGHTDFVDTPEGDWYSFFQGVRPYSPNGDYNYGRETFMLPVIFDEGWPYIIRNGDNISLKLKAPKGGSYVKDSAAFSPHIPHGNFTYKERFLKEELPLQWFYLRTPVSPDMEKRGSLEEGIVIPLEINNIRSIRHTSFIAMRQMHNVFSSEVEMHFLPGSVEQFAGLALFGGDSYGYQFGVSLRDDLPTLILQRSVKQGETIAKEELEVKKLDSGFAGRIILRVERRDDGFVFKYRYSEEAEYEIFKDKVSVEYLSERKTGEFYGTVIGMYASKEEGSEI
ncbi:MAG: glycoside hydrolase family 43 protein [Bacteroidales bacterium]|nr:glycoside hydrolase family 43 protein [Bacteroidales bacterium]